MTAKREYQVEELNQQTARVSRRELERHFARGVVIEVDGGLDLVEVARCTANDDTTALERWLAADQVRHLSVATPSDWDAREPNRWAVVPAPWIAVQERLQ